MIPEIIVGITTGLLATWLSLFQFRSQKLWEKKEEAYRNILEAIHLMRRCNDEWMVACQRGQEVSEERIENLSRVWREALATTLKYSDVGAFLISPKAEEILVHLRSELGKRHDTAYESYDHDAYCLRTALEQLKSVAIAERHHMSLLLIKKGKWIE